MLGSRDHEADPRGGRLGAWAGDLRKWSHPGMQVKRWLVLLLVGLTCVALGIAFVLVQLYRTQPFPEWVYYFTLQPIDRAWRGALFLAAGVGAVGGWRSCSSTGP